LIASAISANSCTRAAPSEEGKGSTFRLDLPLAAAEATELPRAGESRPVIGLTADQPEWRVLVVDDGDASSLPCRQLCLFICTSPSPTPQH